MEQLPYSWEEAADKAKKLQQLISKEEAKSYAEADKKSEIFFKT